jgi:hypothetical protein
MNTKLLILSFLFICNLLQAQIDKKFWFAIPKEANTHGCIGTDNFPNGESPNCLSNNVSFKITAQNLDANVTISMPANGAFAPIIVFVPARTTKIVVLATSWAQFATLYANPGALNGSPIEGITNRGICITADNDITAYYDYDNYWNRDLFSLKGNNALGTEFYTPFQNIWRNDTRVAFGQKNLSEIDIVATVDSTQVQITPSVASQGHAAGIPFIITLNKGQTYSLVAKGQNAINHLTGTHIVSLDPNKPIAVTTNDDSVNVNNTSCADINGDQLVPTNVIGNKYLVMTGTSSITSAGAAVQNINRGEQVFVVTTQPNTTVNYSNRSGTILRIKPILTAGSSDYISPNILDSLQDAIYIYADKPIYVYHITGVGCETGGAILPPIKDCTGSNEITFFRSGTVNTLALNLMIPYDTSIPFNSPTQSYNYFTIYYQDGTSSPISSSWFEPVPDAGFAVLKLANRNIPTALIPVNQAAKIVNTRNLFHLGIINGTNGQTGKYGYFSSFNSNHAEVRVASTNEQNYIGCLGDTIKLIAKGGIEYTWHYGTPTGPSTYISDLKSATPNIINCPVGSHDFFVEIKTPCNSTDTLKISINVLKPTAQFTVDASTICTPGLINIVNKSMGGNVYRWTKQIDNGVPIAFIPSNDTSFKKLFLTQRVFQ